MNERADRRAELLGLIVDDLLAHGAAELSLRPLAERVGASARMLIYHFDTKERLLAEAMAQVRLRVQALLGERAEQVAPRTLRELVMMVWDRAVAPENQRYFRLLFEMDGLALFDRVNFSEAARKANGAVWIALIERGAARLPSEGALFSAHSTLILAALVGLLQDFLSTGERARCEAALSSLVDLISGVAEAARRAQGPS